MTRHCRGILIVGLVIAVAVSGAMAQLSPGDLSEGHASLEGVKNCTKCHDSDQNLVADKCLACHTALKARVDSGRGLHARPEQAECQHCHVEHQGKDFALVYWKDGEHNFDHARTGYVLEGGHRKLACRDCHKSQFMKATDQLAQQAVNLQRTYLGLDRDCRNCHADEHRGQFTQACTECHTQLAWKPASGFAHDKSAFALAGKHRDVACEKCHTLMLEQGGGEDSLFLQFTRIAHNQCSDCHKDPHQTRLGADCARCHTADSWRQVAATDFDHSRTRFPLTGKHAAVQCEKCHAAGQRAAALKFDNCRDCHTDYHKGAFVNRAAKGACEECHTVSGFRPAAFTLAQHDSTDFALAGAHLAIPCLACHKTERGEPARFVFKSMVCSTCHADVHQGSLINVMADSGCTACHSVERWTSVIYDHAAKTQFALEGKHAAVACNKCHKPSDVAQSAIVFGKLSTQCGSCHQDPHRGQFASTDDERAAHQAVTGCDRCHSVNSWQPERFNHATARFVLDGAHSRVACTGCHKSIFENGNVYTEYIGTATTCAACHGSKTPSPRGDL